MTAHPGILAFGTGARHRAPSGIIYLERVNDCAYVLKAQGKTTEALAERIIGNTYGARK